MSSNKFPFSLLPKHLLNCYVRYLTQSTLYFVDNYCVQNDTKRYKYPIFNKVFESINRECLIYRFSDERKQTIF